LKVLLASMDFPPSVGGVAAHVYELGRELVRQDHQVRVETFRIPADALAVEAVAGMDVRREPPGHRLLWRRNLRRQLKRAVAEFKPDVIHVHGLRPLTPAKGLGVPVIFTNHTSGFLQRVERGGMKVRRVNAMMAHAARVIAPSQELIDAGIQVGYPAEKSRYIPNGVDVERFHPGTKGAALRRELGIPEDNLVALAARRMVPKNGMKYLAQAASGFLKEGITLVMVGDGEEFDLVERILKGDGVRDRVVLAGSRANTEMPAFYAAADVVVLPSLKEATSITGLEAMATGKPLVGTRVGGIPELIDEGVSGLLVEPANPTSLADGVKQILSDPELLKSAGNASRERVLEMFSWEVIAARTADIYREVL